MLAVCVFAVLAAQITSLPGLKAELNFAQYSGFLEVDNSTGKFLHYWYALRTAPHAKPRGNNSASTALRC
jgi:hypothetical protein